ncbi:uncharacterized protein mtrm [Chironomus tepperi]|uniref:uncharacterized protein mtrm n=1 Tax=Chironomus tepperi TaxID=113505 RepID=UPI00391F3E21
MSSKLGIGSPMNRSFQSPSIFNRSDQFLKPDVGRRSFSPFGLNQIRTPNISPINKKVSPASPFLKKRDPKVRKENPEKLKNEPELRSNKSRLMDKTLNVKTVLQHLELTKYLDIFNKEEINLDAMFTLSDDDLKSIDINDIQDRKKILDFINCFKTPKKSTKPETNNLHRL